MREGGGVGAALATTRLEGQAAHGIKRARPSAVRAVEDGKELARRQHAALVLIKEEHARVGEGADLPLPLLLTLRRQAVEEADGEEPHLNREFHTRSHEGPSER